MSSIWFWHIVSLFVILLIGAPTLWLKKLSERLSIHGNVKQTQVDSIALHGELIPREEWSEWVKMFNEAVYLMRWSEPPQELDPHNGLIIRLHNGVSYHVVALERWLGVVRTSRRRVQSYLVSSSALAARLEGSGK